MLKRSNTYYERHKEHGACTWINTILDLIVLLETCPEVLNFEILVIFRKATKVLLFFYWTGKRKNNSYKGLRGENTPNYYGAKASNYATQPDYH